MCATYVQLCVEMMDFYIDFVHRKDVDSDTLKAAVAQIEAESGSRFATFFSWLLEVPEVAADIRYLLTKGREQVYTETYIRIHEIAIKKEQTFF